MTNRKILSILALFLVLFIAVGAVSATDNIAVNDVDDGFYNGAVLNDGIENGSFTDLQSAIDNASGTLELDRDYVYNNESDSAYKSGVLLNKSLIINGNNHILDGAGLARIFKVTSNDVTIKDITLINGKSDNNAWAGAIYIDGANFCADNCTFINNKAGSTWDKNNNPVYGGGSLLINKEGCIIQNSRFSGPKNYEPIAGGIVYVNASNAKILNSSFKDSKAYTYAGAIYSSPNSYNLEIIGCNFTNIEGNNGGALTLQSDATVGNCLFDNCSGAFGNAILVGKGKLGDSIPNFESFTLYDSTFVNCHSFSDSAALANGAVDIQPNCLNAEIYGTNLFENCTVIDRSGWGTGAGAIYSNTNNLTIKDSLIIKGCSVLTDKLGGGAIVNYNTIYVEGTLNISDCSADYGGAIFNYGTFNVYGELNIDNCSASEGAAIENLGYGEEYDGAYPGVVLITGSISVKNCEAVYGAIYNNGEGTVNITGSAEFIANEAYEGGAIYNDGILSINNGYFADNYVYDESDSEISGAVIYSGSGSVLIVDNSVFENNNPNQEIIKAGKTELRCVNGGAIYTTGAEVSISNSKFNNNTARWGAACLFNGGNAQVTACNFTSNNVYSATVYILDGTATITNCNFVDNEAKYVGSAGCSASGADIIVYGYESAANVDIKDCNFDQSSATSATAGAGSVHAQANAVINIKDSTFTGVKTTGERGAVHSHKGATINLDNVTFNACESNKGAAISAITGTVNVNNCTFTENIGNYAGVIYVCNNSVLDVKNSVFENNTAKTGALVVVESSNIVLEANKFNNNHANNGVVISATGKNSGVQLTIKNNEFIANDKAPVKLFANSIAINALIESEVDSVVSGNIIKDNSNKAIFHNQNGATADFSGDANIVENNGKMEIDSLDGYIENDGTILGGTTELINKYVAVTVDEKGISKTKVGFVGRLATESGNIVINDNSVKTLELSCEGKGNDYTLEDANVVDETKANFASYDVYNQDFNTVPGQTEPYVNNLTVNEGSSTYNNDSGKIIATGDSLSDLQALIDNLTDGETLFIAGNYSYNPVLDENLTTIVINKTITIASISGNKISASELDNVFTVKDNVNFALSGLIVEAKDNGVAVQMADNANNSVVLDSVVFDGSNITVVKLGSSSTLAVNNIVADGIVEATEGSTVLGNLVISAVKDNNTYNITADATIGGLYVKGLVFNFTSNGDVIGLANDYGNGTYYLNNVDFDYKVGDFVVSADLAGMNITNTTITRNVTIVIEDDYVVYKGSNASVVVILDNKVSGIVELYIDNSLSPQYTVNANAFVYNDGKYYYTFNVDIVPFEDKQCVNVTAVLMNASENPIVSPTRTITIKGKENITNITIELSASSLLDNETLVVSGTIDPTVTGNVSLYIDGKLNATKAIDGTAYEFNVTGLSQGNHSFYVIYSGNNRYNEKQSATKYAFVKYDSNMILVVSDDVRYVDGKTEVTVLVSDFNTRAHNWMVPTGTVEISLNGVTKEANLTTFFPWTGMAYATCTFDGFLANGTYTVSAKYLGDSYYDVSSDSTNITVIKHRTDVDISVSDIDYGKNLIVRAKVDSRATGNITFDVNGAKITSNITNGWAVAVFEGLEAGKYNVTATYSGDAKFLDNVATKTFNVKQINPKFSIDVDDIDYRENATATISLPADVTGNVSFYINGKLYQTVDVIDGSASVNILGLEAGFYYISASFPGDRNYKSANTGKFITVHQINPEFSIDVDDIDYRGTETVNTTLPADAKGYVVYYLNNEFYKVVNVTDGDASVDISGLGAGNYTVGAWYSGDRNYRSMFTSGNFTVNPIDPNLNGSIANFTYGEEGTLILTIDEEAFGNISVDIHGFIYEATIENGTLIIPVDSFDAGDHIAYVIFYSDNENFTGSEIEVPFTIVKADPTIKVDVESNMHVDIIVEGDDVIVTVTLPEDATGTVEFSIDGGITWVSAKVVNGTAQYTFKGLKAGEYTLLVVYSGDNNYNGIETQSTFVVEKAPASIPKACMPNTGNPLLVLLIALSTLGIGSLRRKL